MIKVSKYKHNIIGDIMKNVSIWSEEIDKSKVNSLDTDLDVDVAIVGGGITGLSVAYYLSDIGYNICLLESKEIGEGITSRTTGKITYLQEDLLLKIKDIYNEDVAKKYYESQKEAIKELNRIILENSISCDLKKSDSYIFAENKKDIKKIKELKELLERFGEKIESVYSLPDDTKVKYGIKGNGTYVFNVIKYLKELRKAIEDKIKIYERTKVENIIKDDGEYVLKTKNNEVKARKVIICTHYPFFLFPYLMPLKCSLEKSYVALYKTNSDIEYNAITICKPTISIRYVEGKRARYKLVLAKSHNVNFNNDDKDHFAKISSIKKRPDYLWSNIDVITKDYMPYVGKIDDNLYLATGYNTWGMTNGTLAGLIIKDLIIDKRSEYIELFNPKRSSNMSTFIKYPLYMFNSAYSFGTSKLIKNKSWYSKSVEFKKIKGCNVGIYTDDKGVKHIVKNKCPHLGCSLIFNEVEHTWDCPCHASRFDIDGKVINGPSNYDIHFDE